MRPIAWPSPRPTTLLAPLVGLSLAVAAAAQFPPAPAAPEPSVALPPPLERVLRDYESAWQRKDAAALAALFAEDGFVLSSGNPPVRGRAAIERHYSGERRTARAARARLLDRGRDRLHPGRLRAARGRRRRRQVHAHAAARCGGRWWIVSDMDNGNGRPIPPPSAPYTVTDVDTAHGDREFHLLWPDGAPGAVGSEAADRPKITVYRAPAEAANGTAVVVCPGGGYGRLAADHEGKQVAEWLNSLGVSAFVLQYRLGPRYHHPAPLQDAQRAIRMVRARAAAWGVDPARVGILGFSAGGHLASTAATHFDDGRADAGDPIERQGSRPDFAVLAYPVVSLAGAAAHTGSRRNLLGEPADPTLVELLSNERQVTARTPPTFLFHTADDAAVPVANSLLFFDALRAKGVPGELHVFAHGKHGVGLAPSDPALSQWPRLCALWLEGLGLLARKPA